MGAPWRCLHAHCACNDAAGLIPYLPWWYCGSALARALFVPCVLLLLLLLFVMLGSTADAFFAPTLEQLSSDMGLPPRFAGVTLLALGNGAPDVASTVSAIRAGQYALSLGALTGAGMFVCTCVAGLVMVYSGGAKARGALTRDVGVYAATLLAAGAMLASGAATRLKAAMFLLAYVAFVSSVLAADMYHRRVYLPRQREREEMTEEALDWAEGEDRLEELDALEGVQYVQLGDLGSEHMPGSGLSPDAMYNSRRARSNRPTSHHHHGPNFYRERALDMMARSFSTASRAEAGAGDGDGDSGGEGEGEGEGVDGSDSGGDEAAGEQNEPLGMLDRLRCELTETYAGFKEMGLLSKVLAVLEAPFMALRVATVPMTSREEYVRPYVVLSLTLSPLWLCFYFGVLGEPILVAGGLFGGSVAGALAARAFKDGEAPSGALSYGVAALGFVLAATWIDVIANELVALLQSMGVLLGVDQDLLGLTVLAWGNSIGDLSTNIAMAKKGLGNMSMTACFAGPVFNMLVGLGLGFSTLLYSTGRSSFPVRLDTKVGIGIAMLVVYCVAVIIAGALPLGGRRRLPREFGYLAVMWYALYLLMGSLVVAGLIK